MDRRSCVAAALLMLLPMACGGGGGGGGKGPALREVTYSDINGNGQVDDDDVIIITFRREVDLQGNPLADAIFDLDPSGTFGPAARAYTGFAPREIRIGQMGGGTFQPNGLHHEDPGSSGLNIRPGQADLVTPKGSAIKPDRKMVDIGGEVHPRVASVLYDNTNDNCSVDAGDTLEITFTSNVTATTASPAAAFLLPVSGDTLGTTPQFLGGIPSDTATITVVLGDSPVLSVSERFDGGNLTSGAPSGLDVAGTGEIVDAAHPSVDALPVEPPGVDIGGQTGLIWTSVGQDEADGRFGISVASAGDVNGDGHGDIIIGAPLYDSATQGNAGMALVYHGSFTGLGAVPAWTSSGDDIPGGGFGTRVASAGDVNGDGYADVIVGAPLHADPVPGCGKAWVFHGSPTGLEAIAAWTSQGDVEQDGQFGFSVASAGDIDNDGLSDVLIGQPGYDAMNEDEGRAYFYLGDAAGLPASHDWVASGLYLYQDRFGSCVAGTGDINDDGYDDIAVSGLWGTGRFYIYYGYPWGASTSADIYREGDQWDSGFGTSMAYADVNGDGFSDLIVGAPLYDADSSQRDYGRASAHLGGPWGLTAYWKPYGEHGGSGFGAAVASAGDVNGDGYTDILVGSPGFQVGSDPVGKACFFFGGSNGPRTDRADWSATGDTQVDALFGASLDSAGDVYGRGVPDILIGAWGIDTANLDAGKAYLYCISP